MLKHGCLEFGHNGLECRGLEGGWTNCEGRGWELILFWNPSHYKYNLLQFLYILYILVSIETVCNLHIIESILVSLASSSIYWSIYGAYSSFLLRLYGSVR